MGTRIRIRRSSVPSNRPSLSQLQTGELALNTYDGRLFAIRDEQTALGIGSTVTLLTPWTENIGGGIYYADSSVGIGTTVPTSTLHVVGNSRFDNNLDIGGNLKVEGTTDFIGVVTFRGGTLNLGDSDSDDIFVGGEFSSGLNPTANLALDLGTPTKQWAELHAGSVILSGISTFNQLADFNHSVNIAGVTTHQDDVHLLNNVQLNLGAQNDLSLYNTGNASYIVDSGAGDLFIRGNAAIRLQDALGNENYAVFNVDGAAELFYDAKKKFATSEQGVGIAGSITVDNDLLVTGVSTFVGQVNFDNSDFDGQSTFDDINVSGVSTFASHVDLNSDLDVDGKTNLDDLSVSGVSTFAKFVDIESNLNVDGTAEIDNLNVSGITTTNTLLFNNYLKGGNNDKIYLGNDNDLIIYHTGTTGYIDNNRSHLYIRNNVDDDDGGNIYIQAKSGEQSITCFDDSGVYLYFNGNSRLYTTNSGVTVNGNLQVTNDVTINDDLIVSDFLDVQGGAEIDKGVVLRDRLYVEGNLRALGVSTLGNYTFRNDVIEGPSELIIDPAGIGDNTGLVRIKGDLYVDGDQFVVSSSTIELADHVVGIASTTSSDLLTDGAGIGIGGASVRKTFTYNQSSDALKSSEHLDVALNKTYKIDGTDVLSATTLGSGVVNSSLTSVGTLLGLTVSGQTSLNTLEVTGVSTFTGSLYLKSDSEKLILGAGDDLEIYHSGSYSYIDNKKSNLYIRNNVDDDDNGDIYIQAKSGENSILCADDGSVYLYHDGAEKFRTSTYGALFKGILYIPDGGSTGILVGNTGVSTLPTVVGTNLTYDSADINNAYVTTGIVTTLQGTDVTYTNAYVNTGVVTTIQGTDASYTNAYVNTGVVTALSVPSNGTLDVDGKTDLDDLNVAGVATFTAGSNGDTKIGFGNTALIVEGDARIIGVLTIGSSSLTLDGDNNIINVGSGVTIDGNTNVIQLGSDVTIDSGGLDVAGVSSITATTIFGDIDGELNAPGNTHYVATTGDDDHTGDNINQPYRTLAKALSVASDGDVIHIAAGDYAETCPLTVPAGVTVRGNGMRSVTVRPTDSTKTENVFLLNNLSTIEDLTIKGSYYRSAGDTGYAFAYQPGIAITNRSPYIQRVTVLNRGSNVTADDPYGYDTADSPPTSYVAGRGAKVDGSLVDSESLEAGMLFNEVTFFTPNSKGIILTNGARAEYLNCFHYFASEAIVGESGSVGIASTAGSRLNVVGVTTTLSANDVVKQFDGGGNVVAIGTVKTFDSPYIVLTEKGSGIFTAIGAGSTNDVRFYDSDGTTQRGYADRVAFADYTMFGAELRSVGCAVEYGSKGVIADGDGVNMRLFALNFNHVGSGKDFSNDPTTSIQANETTQLNNGEVSYVSIDHKGDFRVGESFYVNQETGSVSFAATSVNLEVTGNMDVTDGVDTSTLTPTSLSVGNLQLAANTFSSTAGDIVIDPANNSETRIQGDLSVIGILTASTISVDSLQTGDSSIAIDDTGSNGTIRFNTDGSEAFRVDSSQRIGIGTNNPDRTLTVEGDFDTYGQTQHYGDLRVTGVSTLPTLNGTELTYTTADIDNAYVTTGIVTTLQGTDATYANLYGVVGVVTTISGTDVNYTNANLTSADIDNAYVTTGIVTTLQGTDATYANLYGVVGVVTTISGTDVNYTNANLTSADIDNAYVTTGIVTTLSVPSNGTLDVDGKTDLNDLSVAGVATFSANVDLLDDDKLRLGAGQELQIFYNSTNNNSVITESGSGNLNINADNLNIRSSSSNENKAKFNTDGAVILYYDNVEKLETKEQGVGIAGSITVDNDLEVTGVTTFQSHVYLGDDTQLKIGDSEDLRIYHAGGTSIIQDQGAGSLSLRGDDVNIKNSAGGEFKAKFFTNGAVELYYDNVLKFNTTEQGVGIAGSITVDNDLLVAGVSTFQSNVFLGDSDELTFGDGKDLFIYSNGTNGLIRTASGSNLIIRSETHRFKNQAGTEDLATFTENGSVELYYDNSKKFETKEQGVGIAGSITVDNDLLVAGVTTFQGDVHLGDNDVLYIGDGNFELQMYHNGSNSIIRDNGPGNLILGSNGDAVKLTKGINSENLAIFNVDGSVDLYYDNSKKFETKEQGVGIAGSITVDNDLDVTGVSTFASHVDLNSDLDVDGKTDLDDLSVAGVATFSAPVGGGVTTLVVEGDQRITGILTVGTASVTINGTTTEVHVGSATTLHSGGYQIGNSDIHSSGATLEHSNVLGVSTVGVELSAGGVVTANTGGLNVAGVTTATAFHTGAEGSAIRVTSNTISGPATLNIDPAGVGDNTGTVVIKGDLQVDGTQTIVNSNTVTIDDKNIVLANGAANDAAADGGGITLESGDGNKTINWVDSTDAWTFSEHVNLASTKTYNINGTEVLSATTLGSGVVNSSLTSVGTITTGTWQGTAIANAYLANSSISIGGVSLSLGDTDATPALDLQDATNYPYASLTGVTTSIVGDTTPQLGGNLDLNSSDITGTGDVNITGSVTASAAINSSTDVQINGTSVLTSASDEAVALAIALG